MTPEGYVFSAILTIAIVTSSTGVWDEIRNKYFQLVLFQDIIPDIELLDKYIVNLILILAENSLTIVSEILFVGFIFAMATPYRLLLGLKNDRAKIFIEYY